MDDRVVTLLVAGAFSLVIGALGLAVAIVVHELAHVVLGYAAGLRVARVNLGPLEIRDSGRPRVRLVPSLLAGVVLLPFGRSTGLGTLRSGLIFSTAAGPLVGIAFGAVLLMIDRDTRRFDPLSIVDATAQLSVILGVLNLIPLRTGDTITDGRRVISLLVGGKECGQILAMTLLVGEAMSGTRPRDWDPALLTIMERWPDDPSSRLCLYEAAMDRGDVDVAGKHLDAAVALRGERATAADAILFNEAAFYTARHRRDARKARAWLGLGEGWTVLDYMRARAEAAVLCAEGRVLEGRQCAVAGLAALDRAGRRDEDLCRDQLEDLARTSAPSLRPLLARVR